MNSYTLSIDCSKPEDIARGIQAAIEQSNTLRRELDAHHGVLIGLFVALGQCRHSPFVTHTEIEAALLSMVSASHGWEGTSELASSLLAIYRGDIPPADASARPALRLVRTEVPDCPAMLPDPPATD